MDTMKIWYENEAREWTQALPLGNGHLGAMAYGGAAGLFDLSENTCWSGAEQDQYLDSQAGHYMAQVRQLLSEKKIAEAEELIFKCRGRNENYGTQMPMGRLYAGISGASGSRGTGAAAGQPDKTRRELDLATGICLDQIDYGQQTIRRESFISNPDKVMAVRMSAGGSVLPQLRVWLEGWSQPATTTPGNDELNELIVRGRALENMHSDGLHGVEYMIRLSIVTDGLISWSRSGLLIDQATSLALYLTAATSMFFIDIALPCRQFIEAATAVSWETLAARHSREHAAWMNRCSLDLPASQAGSLPIDQRILAFRKDPSDYALIALFFQYGRYLLLNSSRPDSLLPAALQGVWNDDRACRMAWTDDMHLDINTQMNYYPAEVTGLAECLAPLFSWIRQRLVPSGERIARELYGAEGWVAHTVSNAYGWAAPGWHLWGFFVTGGAWVAAHIWNYYLYTRDQSFLQENFSVLYGAARFLQAILTVDPATGELVVNPSYSPENVYLYEGNGHCITTGSTADTNIARYIFSAVAAGAEILSCQDEFTRSLPETAARLPGFRIGRHGQLMEWHEDFAEARPDHRHTSHLLAMHPFNLINPEQSPELAEAIKTTLARRLGENALDIVLANWAGALLILYQARLLDGEKAGEFIKPMISFLSRENMMITHEGPTTSITGGIYELDGNTGLTAGIAEMLLQSYAGEIHILPAIPSAWKQGAFQGLVAQGGHRVDVQWADHQVQAAIHAHVDGMITVRYQDSRQEISIAKGQTYLLNFKPEEADHPGFAAVAIS